MTVDEARELDAADPLAFARARFRLPEGVIYLDGNSLGALPKATPARVAQVVEAQWGQDLITSWNKQGWIDLPRRVGDKIARLVGATPGEVMVADSTSINLFKLLAAARPTLRLLFVGPDRGLERDDGSKIGGIVAFQIPTPPSGPPLLLPPPVDPGKEMLGTMPYGVYGPICVAWS